MASELGIDTESGDLAGARQPLKKWDITQRAGFQAWSLRVQALIAATPGAMSIVDTYIIDHAAYMAADPSFASAGKCWA